MRASLTQPDRRDRQMRDPAGDRQTADMAGDGWPEPSADQHPDEWVQAPWEPSVSDDDLATWFG